MRFLIDAQLPPGLARHLESRGLAAEHVAQLGLAGATDRQIWQAAVRKRAVLVTKDEDFVALASKTSEGPAIVWIRLGNITNTALWETLAPVLDEILMALTRGEMLVEVK